MKRVVPLLILIFMSCSETQLVDYWQNPDVDTYSPTKVLVVGLTTNREAKIKFETHLKSRLEDRGIEAIRGTDVTPFSQKKGGVTEKELNALEMSLIDQGFDTILFSKVVGVEDKITYKENPEEFDETYRRFKEDYLRYQDIFYHPEYYDEYTIYHAETAMYCICPTKDRELIWKGYIDITDPKEVDKTVQQYVNLIILALEELQLLESLEMQPAGEESLQIN